MSKKKPKFAYNIAPQKNSRAAIFPSPSKQAKIHTLKKTDSYNPSWQFSHLELVDPFGWHKITVAKLHEIHERLKNFETMTWHDILITGKKHNHSIEIHKLSKLAMDRLKETKLDDIEKLISLKVSSRERIWGIKHQTVLLLLWWDPKHQVCPLIKKHT